MSMVKELYTISVHRVTLQFELACENGPAELERSIKDMLKRINAILRQNFTDAVPLIVFEEPDLKVSIILADRELLM